MFATNGGNASGPPVSECESPQDTVAGWDIYQFTIPTFAKYSSLRLPRSPY
jgi:hypothetical protein